MTPQMVAVILLIVFAVLLVLRMPIGFSLLFTGLIGYITIRGVESTLGMVGSRLYDIGSSYDLSVVPLFLLMGHLSFAAGITHELYVAARAWVGHIKGGLVLATTAANAGFGACCGSTTAATAVFGKIAIPEMLRSKIDRSLAAGSVAAGGTLSGLIPPSVNLIIYGIAARASIARLLIAGLIPGLLTAVAYGVMVYVRVRKNPKLAPPQPEAPLKEKFSSVKGVWGIFLLALLVMGGLFMGIFTPTEAGAIGAAGAFVIVLARRKLSRGTLRESFLETAQATSVIFIVLVGAMIFSSYLAVSGTSAAISTSLLYMPVPPIVLVGIYMALLIALGCVIDPVSIIFLTVPIFVPPLREMGLDPIWLGILVAKCQGMGALTPPLGINAFMLKSVVPEFSLRDIFSGINWFLAVDVVVLVILIFFPRISLLLPNLMFGVAP